MAQSFDIRAYEGRSAGLIMLGVPTFGAVSIEWHGHMMQLQAPLNRSIRHLCVKGQEVGAARNAIVRHALNYKGLLGEQFSHVFFVDDDVLVPKHALAQLLSHNRPIVSGLYYAKMATPQPLILADSFGGLITDWKEGDLVDCRAHGMGCTLIAREVFEAVGEPWFQTTNAHLTAPDGAPVTWHQTEDVYFLHKAREAGFQPCVDTGLFCFHYSMAERVGYPLDRWQASLQQAQEAVPA